MGTGHGPGGGSGVFVIHDLFHRGEVLDFVNGLVAFHGCGSKGIEWNKMSDCTAIPRFRASKKVFCLLFLLIVSLFRFLCISGSYLHAVSQLSLFYS